MGNLKFIQTRPGQFVFCLLCVVLILSNTSSSAQDIAIGIRGGISIPNLTASGSEQNPLNTGYSSRLGPEFGLFAEFKISELFSLQPMIEYSSQGGKKTVCRHFRFLPTWRPCFLRAGTHISLCKFQQRSEIELSDDSGTGQIWL